MKEKKFFSALHLKTACHNQIFVLVFWIIEEIVTSQLPQYSTKYYDLIGEGSLLSGILNGIFNYTIRISISDNKFITICPLLIIMIVSILIKIPNIFFGIRNSDYGYKVGAKITGYNYFLTVFDMINTLIFTVYILVLFFPIRDLLTRGKFYIIDLIILIIPLLFIVLNTLWFTVIIFIEGKKQKSKD